MVGPSRFGSPVLCVVVWRGGGRITAHTPLPLPCLPRLAYLPAAFAHFPGSLPFPATIIYDGFGDGRQGVGRWRSWNSEGLPHLIHIHQFHSVIHSPSSCHHLSPTSPMAAAALPSLFLISHSSHLLTPSHQFGVSGVEWISSFFHSNPKMKMQ